MSSCRSLVAVALLVAAGSALAQSTYPGIGRVATASELAAWDIDVRPDFKGLPRGKGSVAQGQDVWEAKCASCHGIFGEANSTFSPLVGGTTKDDLKSGRVARLTDPAYPGRTTLMKLSTVSTLWDYINRAMPWTAPKSLSADEVYAVTAFLLNLGGVLPDDFVLSDATMAQAQSLLPNRNGMTTDHAMWPGGKPRKPDVQGSSCMKDCPVEADHASLLPDHARNAHGNLAEQNRLVGAQHGADTTRPAGAAAPAGALGGEAGTSRGTGVAEQERLQRLPHGGHQAGRPGPARHREEVRRAGRRGRLPRRQDPCRRKRRVGPHPDAGADPARGRRPRHCPVAHRRGKEVSTEAQGFAVLHQRPARQG